MCVLADHDHRCGLLPMRIISNWGVGCTVHAASEIVKDLRTEAPIDPAGRGPSPIRTIGSKPCSGRLLLRRVHGRITNEKCAWFQRSAFAAKLGPQISPCREPLAGKTALGETCATRDAYLPDAHARLRCAVVCWVGGLELNQDGLHALGRSFKPGRGDRVEKSHARAGRLASGRRLATCPT